MYGGIDVSTNVIGISILDENKKIIDMFFEKNNSEMTFNEKIDNFFNIISECIKKYNIINISMEDSLLMMTSGNSVYNTVLKLVALNSIITYLIEKNYPNVKLNKFLPIQARKKAWNFSFTEKIWKNIEYDNIPKTSWKKHHIYLTAKKKYPDIDKFMKFNSKDKFKSENYDCIDSLTMALCCYE